MEIIVAAGDKKLSRLARAALCPTLKGLGLGARFADGGRCGHLAAPSPCRSLMLAIADSSSNVDALKNRVLQARRVGRRPARLLVLKVGPPGVPAALDDLADLLDNGRSDRSAVASSAHDEKEARDVLLATLDELLLDDQATPPVIIGGPTPRPRPPKLAIASTRLPLRQGELRLLAPDGKLSWSAGRNLARRPARTRRVYSAHPTIAGGRAIPLVLGRGSEMALNLRGGGDFGPHGLIHLWPGGARAAPAPERLKRFVREELLGEGRRWQLAPVAGPPALLAFPPWRPTLEAHARFAAKHSRQSGRLFLATRDGLLHVFDAGSGAELFTFVPAHLLPRLFAHASRRPKASPPPIAPAFRVPTTPPRLTDIRRDGKWTTALVYTAGAALTLLDVRAQPLRALALPPSLAAAPRGQRWLTPSLAPRPKGALWLAASRRPPTGKGGSLAIGALTTPTSSSPPPPPRILAFHRPSQAVIEADSRTHSVRAVVIGDGRGDLWRLASPSYSPTRVAHLGPRHAFEEAPAVFRRGKRSLIAAISHGMDEARLVIWREGEKTLICRLSELCRCPGAKFTSCKAPPPGLVSRTQPLIVASPRGLKIFSLLVPKANACPEASSFLLQVDLDPRWNFYRLATRRLGRKGARQLSLLRRELMLIEAKIGQRARLRLLGPVAPIFPGGSPRVEAHREIR